MADEAFFAHLQGVAFAMLGASADRGSYHLAACLVVKINIGFQASERLGSIVHNLVDELVKIKNRGDLLGGLLQLQQVLYLHGLQGSEASRSKARDRRRGSHETVSPRQS